MFVNKKYLPKKKKLERLTYFEKGLIEKFLQPQFIDNERSNLF